MTLEYPLILTNWTLPPSGEWAPQGSGWNMVRVAEGSGYCLVPGNTCGLNGGDGLISPMSEGLQIRASQLGTLRLQLVRIQPEFISGLLTVTEWHQLRGMERQSPCIFFFKAADLTGQKFARLADQASGESLSARCAWLQLWASVLVSVLVTSPMAPGDDKKLRQHFRHLLAKMPEKELFKQSLTALADQLNCSERHFSRLFRLEFGGSFRRHQIEMRLQHARQMLGDENYKVATIAKESGYNHLGLFNATFKKRFGMTPSEWRRQNVSSRLATPLRNGSLLLGSLPGYSRAASREQL